MPSRCSTSSSSSSAAAWSWPSSSRSPATTTSWPLVRADVQRTAGDLDMDVETVPGAAEDDERRRNRIHVTMMGAPLEPAAIADAAAEIAERGGNIDRIRRIASYPVTAIEFQGSGVSARRPPATARRGGRSRTPPTSPSRRPVSTGGASTWSSWTSTPRSSRTRSSTCSPTRPASSTRSSAITERAMAGELDFEQSLRARAALLEGLPDGRHRPGARPDHPDPGSPHPVPHARAGSATGSPWSRAASRR